MKDLAALVAARPEFDLDELASEANRHLPELLPDEPVDARVKPEVNPRLIRHYVSEGLLDPSLREGKRAVYTVDHLLQVLALRRLLADGLSSTAIGESLRGKARDELRRIAEGNLDAFLSPSESAPASADDARARARAALASIRGDAPVAEGFGVASSPPSFAGAVHRARDPSDHRGLDEAQSWERVPLLDGVELHVRADVRLPASLDARQRLLDHIVREIVRHAQRRER